MIYLNLNLNLNLSGQKHLKNSLKLKFPIFPSAPVS